MKRFLFLILILVVSVQAQLPSHPIGVLSVKLEPYKLYFLGMPFDNTNAYNNIMSQLPEGSTFSSWDKSAFKYSMHKIKNGRTGNQDVQRGDGFFISTSEEITLRLYGDVPDSTNFTKQLNRGFNMCSLPYPVDTDLSTDSLVDSLMSGSMIITWDSDAQKYTVALKTKDKWTQDEILISPEQGFWINQKIGRLVWDTSKPYVYP